MGFVDVAIGGLGSSWALATVGIGATSLAIGLRWWIMRRSRPQLPETIAEYYLPPATSRPPLPRLDEVKSRSSRPYN